MALMERLTYTLKNSIRFQKQLTEKPLHVQLKESKLPPLPFKQQ